MSIYDYKDPILGKRRKGTIEDPFVDISQTVQVDSSSAAQLAEIPDRFNRVTIPNMVEVEEVPPAGLASNQFLVDYTMGLIFVHSSLIGTSLTISYKGTGAHYFPASRIWTKSGDGINVDETLETLMEVSNNFSHKGLYDSTVAYVTRNIIEYRAATYMCIADAPVGTLPTNQTYFRKITGFAYKGAYSTTTTYNSGDFVVDGVNENLYMSLVDANLNSLLTDTTKWERLVSVSSIVASLNSAESARVTAENNRVSAENSRVTAESSRVTAENSRVTAENTRSTNESTRQNNETTRQSNETTRQTAINELVHKGEWISTTAYKVRNIVSLNGSGYMCIADNTNISPPNATYWKLVSSKGDQGIQGIQGVQGIQGIQGEEGLFWKGAYSSTTAYVVDDAVSYNGSSYICISNTTAGTDPTNTTYWSLLAQKGVDGSGSVSSVTSASGDISVANTTTTPVLTLNSGTGANQIVKRNASGKIDDLENVIQELASNAFDANDPIDRYPNAISTFGLVGATSSGFPSYGTVQTYRGFGDNDSFFSYQYFLEFGSQPKVQIRKPLTTSKTAWTASTAYALNDLRMPTSANENGIYYKCTTAGTSGATEPVWTTTIGATVADGTAVWTAEGKFWSDWVQLLDSSDTTRVKTTGDTMTGELKMLGASPQIHWEDNSDANAVKHYWLHVNAGRMYFLHDRSGDGAWDSPHPAYIESDGKFVFGFEPYVNANKIWHAGIFDPATKANLSGATFTGTIFGAGSAGAIADATGSKGKIEVRSNGTTSAAILTFHRPGAFAAYLGIDTDNRLKFGGWSAGAVSYPVMLHKNGGQSVFVQSAAPTAGATNDIWIQT
jgi:hypothetical protein